MAPSFTKGASVFIRIWRISLQPLPTKRQRLLCCQRFVSFSYREKKKKQTGFECVRFLTPFFFQTLHHYQRAGDSQILNQIIYSQRVAHLYLNLFYIPEMTECVRQGRNWRRERKCLFLFFWLLTPFFFFFSVMMQDFAVGD
jgi:hypothetical protein